MKFLTLITAILSMLVCTASAASGRELNDYLSSSHFVQGIADYEARTQSETATNEERFSLGVLLFVKAVEGLSQDLYRLGLDREVGRKANLPFLWMPVPLNENPEKATPEAIRGALERFHGNILKVNKALQDLGDEEFNVPVDIRAVPIDLNGDGMLSEGESFHQIFIAYNRRSRNLFTGDKPFLINFDLGDAYWLKGYSHLLLAMTDTLLAHDWGKVYTYTAGIFFTTATRAIQDSVRRENTRGLSEWADLIAGIHVMDLPVTNAERLKRAHYNLKQTVVCSRQSWSCYGKESDDLNEWIPNPNQTGVTGARISQEMLDQWMVFLDEFEAILSGEKLIPHWRINTTHGINLKRVFYEPRPFDLVLWIQGSAALPYIEEGDVSSRDTWLRIRQVFRGNFVRFIIWVN